MSSSTWKIDQISVFLWEIRSYILDSWLFNNTVSTFTDYAKMIMENRVKGMVVDRFKLSTAEMETCLSNEILER